MTYEYRAYWDRVGHKRNCAKWGDDMDIMRCTCGPPPQTATGRLIYDIGRYMLQGGGGGSYHNPHSSYTIGTNVVPPSSSLKALAAEYVDVDYPGAVAAVDLGRTESTVVYGRRSMNRRETIKSRMRQLEEELAKIDRFPQDTFPNGTVLKFEKLFDITWEAFAQLSAEEQQSFTVYVYAAVKAGGYWYCSGQPSRSPQRAHWDRLIEWMGDGVQEVWLMGKHTELITGDRVQEGVKATAEITGGGGPGTAENPTEALPTAGDPTESYPS